MTRGRLEQEETSRVSEANGDGSATSAPRTASSVARANADRATGDKREGVDQRGLGRGRYGSRSIDNLVKAAGRGAGVPGRHHVHRYRHTYATDLVRREVDISLVQKAWGTTGCPPPPGTYTSMSPMSRGPSKPPMPT